MSACLLDHLVDWLIQFYSPWKRLWSTNSELVKEQNQIGNAEGWNDNTIHVIMLSLRTPPLSLRFWKCWCQNVPLDVIDYNKNSFRPKRLKLTEIWQFLFPVNQSINWQSPWTCKCTVWWQLVSGKWMVDWLIDCHCKFTTPVFRLSFAKNFAASESQK